MAQPGKKPAIRTFIAWSLKDRDRQMVGALQSELRKKMNGCRWVDPGLLHITLRFAGDTDTELIGQKHRQITEMLKDVQPLELDLNCTGVFPERGRARILWLGSKPVPEQVLAVGSMLHEKFSSLFSLVPEKFTPHITIARSKTGLEKSDRDAYIGFDFGTHRLTLDRIVWYESRQTGGRLQYDIINEYELLKRNGDTHGIE